MILEKLLSALLSLPFFKSIEISQNAIDNIKSMASFVAQANQIVNFSLLVEVVVTVLGAYVFCALARLVIDLL